MTSEESYRNNRQECFVFTSILLIALSIIIMIGFQNYLIVLERMEAKNELARQVPVMEQAIKMRAQLDAIAEQTAKVAEKGNPNAMELVEQLKKAGVIIHPKESGIK